MSYSETLKRDAREETVRPLYKNAVSAGLTSTLVVRRSNYGNTWTIAPWPATSILVVSGLNGPNMSSTSHTVAQQSSVTRRASTSRKSLPYLTNHNSIGVLSYKARCSIAKTLFQRVTTSIFGRNIFSNIPEKAVASPRPSRSSSSSDSSGNSLLRPIFARTRSSCI